MASESSPKEPKSVIMETVVSAEIFIEKYGRDAPRQAKLRADELIAFGNHQGGELWLDIYKQTLTILNEK